MAAIDLIPIIASELVGHANLAGAITMAEGQIAADHCFLDEVVAYTAAHILTVAGRSGSGGAIASETEGSLSRSFAAGGDGAGLGSTSYGLEVKRLNRLCYGFSARTGYSE